jgi:hypothetical protein
MIATCGSPIEPEATATPSVARTGLSSAASNGGTVPSSVSTSSRDVMTASTPSVDSVKISSNDRSIVSVRM